MQETTTTLVTTIAYLIGVRDEILERDYADQTDYIETLKKNKEATIIRYLSKIRTSLMLNYLKVDSLMRYDMKNLHTMPEYFDEKEIRWLDENNIQIIKANYKADQYLQDITELINNRISNCSGLFQDWQRFDLIKDLFKIPKAKNISSIKNESQKFSSMRGLYPYTTYIHWTAHDCGNLLLHDRKFMVELLKMNGETFEDESKTHDVDESTKVGIYDYISDSDKTVMLVDCENSDIFKLASVLKGLGEENLQKVSKIVLFDDYHTSNAWDRLGQYVHLPVEHIEVERVMDSKSQVDMTLAVSCCKEYYENHISSFVLFSSDSDYWALISSLPQVSFLIMYEDDKMSDLTKNILWDNGYVSCCIDDFCTASTEEFQRLIMITAIRDGLPDMSQINLKELIKEALYKARLDYSDAAVNIQFRKYAKQMKLSISDDGSMKFEL